MEQEQQIQFSVETLMAVKRHEHRRMATGHALRTYLHEQLALGNEPNHYRLEWIRQGVGTTIHLLKELASEFNAAHQDDKISVGDMLDVLDSTMRTLRARSGYKDSGE